MDEIRKRMIEKIKKNCPGLNDDEINQVCDLVEGIVKAVESDQNKKREKN